MTGWLGSRVKTFFVASLTVAEIRRGILDLPSGKKRDALEKWFTGNDGLQALFAGRTLSFDDRAGLIWARLMADGKTAGHPRRVLDMIVAAVAMANDCVVVTDNRRDFRGIHVFNPLRNGATREE